MNYDDETLMAYADGELDEARRAAIARDIERDPQLARRVQQHRALRSRVAGAFAPVADQPVPGRLTEVARGGAPGDARRDRGAVLAFPGRPAPRSAKAWGHWPAMAASLVLGMVLAWQFLAPPAPELTAGQGALVANGALARALDEQRASTQSQDAAVQVGISFRARDGGYCRSFTLRSARTAGLACRTAGEWRVAVTAAADLPDGGMRQAASPPLAVLQAIEARIAGEPLDAAAEQEAARAGWDGAGR
jgi:hypothetical protein